MNFDNVLQKSRSLRKIGRHAEAVELLNEALRSKSDARLFYSRAMTFDQIGQAGRAVEDLASAIALENTNPIYLFDRACILAFPLDRHDEAIHDFDRVLQLMPDHVDAHRQCCGSLLIMGRPNRALEHAEAALRLAPNEASTYFYLGETYMSLKRFDEAVTALLKAVELDPTKAEHSSALRRAEEHLRARDIK